MTPAATITPATLPKQSKQEPFGHKLPHQARRESRPMRPSPPSPAGGSPTRTSTRLATLTHAISKSSTAPAQERQEDGPYIADDNLREGNNTERSGRSPVIAYCCLQLLCDGRHFRLRCMRGDAVTQPSYSEKVIEAPHRLVSAERLRGTQNSALPPGAKKTTRGKTPMIV